MIKKYKTLSQEYINHLCAEENYPELISLVMEYTIKVKEKDKDVLLTDIIIDFSSRNNIDIEYIGDAISSDEYFKSFIEQDCKMNKQFKSNINREEW